MRGAVFAGVAVAVAASCGDRRPAPTPTPPPPMPEPVAALHASGFEPGWTLDLSRSGGLALAVDYGEHRLSAPWAAPQLDGGRTVFQLGTAARPVTVTVERAPCTDAAGRTQPFTVTVRLPDRTLAGCGSPPS